MAERNKKPNSFLKGMQSDVDPNLLPEDSYKSAYNARLITKGDNLYTISAAEGNTLVKDLSEGRTTISNIAISGGPTTDTRTIGSTNYSVERYVEEVTVSLVFGGTTYSYTLNQANSLFSDVSRLTQNAFINLFYDSQHKTTIQASFGIVANYTTGTVNIKPHFPTIVGEYSVSGTVTEKSRTFKVWDTFSADALGSDTDISLTTTISSDGIFHKNDTQSALQASLSFVANWSTQIDLIEILEFSINEVDSLAKVTQANTTYNQGLIEAGINETEDAVFLIGKTDEDIDFSAELNRSAEGGVTYTSAIAPTTITTNNSAGYSTGTKDITFDTNTETVTYEILALLSFQDYIAAFVNNASNNKSTIVKLSVNSDGTIEKFENIFEDLDLGLTSKTKLRTEISEENELYHRVYWTDGVNPLRSINLKESEEYYQNLSSADDFNVFNSRFQTAPEVNSIIEGGAVRCGSHSYCYRLKSSDGKLSKVSNISEPVHIFKSSRSNDYHDISGGPAESENNISSSSVRVKISDVSSTFTEIDIINIYYIDKLGAIETSIISSGSLVDGSYSYLHTGNETTDSIAVAELFAVAKPWDTCKSLAIKDNRLFAANLGRVINDIDLDFRAKSYRKNRSSGEWEKHSEENNPDIYEDVLYEDGIYNWDDVGRYGYLKGSDFNQSYIPGAESDGYATGLGVRVTFDVKEIDLGDQIYFQVGNTGTYDDGDNQSRAFTGYNKAPLYSQNLSRDGEDGLFNNYKNPIVAQKYKGYQRGEIYRFGILFYDKALNPGFVSPIGDIRMPDNATKFANLDEDGNVVTKNASGSKFFKHCGAESFSITGATISGSNIQHPADTRPTVGFTVYGNNIQPGTCITAVAGSTEFTMSKPAYANSSGSETQEVFFLNPTIYNTKGFVLHPVFDVKLDQATRDKIGGYSIVRVDRTDSDKRILHNGITTGIMPMHNNNSSTSSLKNRNGVFAAAHGTPSNRHKTALAGEANFTFDSPTLNLAQEQYNHKDGDRVMLNARLDAVQNPYSEDFIPEGSPIVGEHRSWSGVRTKVRGNISAGRMWFGGEGATNNTAGLSLYTIFTLNDDSLFYYNSHFGSGKLIGPKGSRANDLYRKIGSAVSVESGESVSSSHITYDLGYTGATSKDFRNRALVMGGQSGSTNSGSGLNIYASPKEYTHLSFNASDDGYDDIYHNGKAVLDGCPTTFITLDDTHLDLARIFCGRSMVSSYGSSDYQAGGNDLQYINYYDDMPNPEGAELYASKAYVSIVRNVGASIYGGNEPSNFFNNKYILTGHENFTPTTSLQRNKVFGGDTYINMYSLRKLTYHASSGNGLKNNIGFVFPVESTVNVDMRDGDYLGVTDDLAHNLDDDQLYNDGYSARNTVKTYVQKPSQYQEVGTMSNMIAASNLKLSGSTSDSFTSFPAAETHELNTKYGPIYNMFNLRGDLFTLQSNAVAKLSINPRVVVDNADAAAVTIATGTGRVIERSDYIDTQYGSQHYNNVITTGVSAYWFDSYISSFCKLSYGQGLMVQDLGVTTQNANIFDSLKDLTLADKPLDATIGGVCLSYDYRHSEVTLSLTYSDYTKNTTISYSELTDLMVSRKHQSICLSTLHKGEQYTVGVTKLSEGTELSNSALWLENSLGSANSYYGTAIPKCLDVTFVCNESVYSTKKFDKLVMYSSGNNNSKKFTTFTFTDSKSNSSFENAGLGDKMSNGKHIIPITNGTDKAEGQYLIINATAPTTNYPVELFGALVHNRIVK